MPKDFEELGREGIEILQKQSGNTREITSDNSAPLTRLSVAKSSLYGTLAALKVWESREK